MMTRISAVALAALMLVAAALPATAGGRGKGSTTETTAPRGGVLGGAREGTAGSRDHRGDNPRGGGVTVTVKRVRSICTGWGC